MNENRDIRSTDEKIAWIMRAWATAGITIIASQMWNISQRVQVQQVQIESNSSNIELLLKELVERRRLEDEKSSTE